MEGQSDTSSKDLLDYVNLALCALLIALDLYAVLGHNSPRLGDPLMVGVIIAIPIVIYIFFRNNIAEHSYIFKVVTYSFGTLFISLLTYIMIPLIEYISSIGTFISLVCLIFVLIIIFGLFKTLSDGEKNTSEGEALRHEKSSSNGSYLYFLVVFFIAFILITLQVSLAFAFHDAQSRYTIIQRSLDYDIDNDTLRPALNYGLELESNYTRNSMETILLFSKDSVNINVDDWYLVQVRDYSAIPDRLVQDYGLFSEDHRRALPRGDRDRVVSALNAMAVREIKEFVDNNENSNITITIEGNASREQDLYINNSAIARMRYQSVRNYLQRNHSISNANFRQNRCMISYVETEYSLNSPHMGLNLLEYHDDSIGSENYQYISESINDWTEYGRAYSVIVNLESTPFRDVPGIGNDQISHYRSMTLLDYIYLSSGIMMASGYGDITPNSNYAKMINILINMFQIVLMVFMFSAFSHLFQKSRV